MFNVESSGEKIVTNYPSRVLESTTKDMMIIIRGKRGEFKHLRAGINITVVDQSSVSQLKVPLHHEIVEMYCMSQC